MKPWPTYVWPVWTNRIALHHKLQCLVLIGESMTACVVTAPSFVVMMPQTPITALTALSAAEYCLSQWQGEFPYSVKCDTDSLPPNSSSDDWICELCERALLSRLQSSYPLQVSKPPGNFLLTPFNFSALKRNIGLEGLSPTGRAPMGRLLSCRLSTDLLRWAFLRNSSRRICQQWRRGSQLCVCRFLFSPISWSATMKENTH